MEHDRNQFIVNVFTNGAAPEEKRGDSQEHDMAYIESCREMFRLRSCSMTFLQRRKANEQRQEDLSPVRYGRDIVRYLYTGDFYKPDIDYQHLHKAR